MKLNGKCGKRLMKTVGEHARKKWYLPLMYHTFGRRFSVTPRLKDWSPLKSRTIVLGVGWYRSDTLRMVSRLLTTMWLKTRQGYGYPDV